MTDAGDARDPGDAATTVDLVVIGLGPGGEALASACAKAGLEVVAVDKHLVGGECPYYGCVPTKMMVRAADSLAEAGRADQLAGDVTAVPSWAPVAERVAEQATDHWDDKVAVERLEDAGATVLHGTARLAGPGRVLVAPTTGGSPTTYSARKGVVLNPGTRPSWPGIPGLEGTPFWTNRDAVQVTTLPGTLVVLGGGPIGCELAQVFSRFGVQVTVVQHGDHLVPGDEPEASAILEDVFVHEGIRVLTGIEATERLLRARHLLGHPRRRPAPERRQAPGRGRSQAQLPGPRPVHRRPRPLRAHPRGRRADARGRRRPAVGDR